MRTSWMVLSSWLVACGAEHGVRVGEQVDERLQVEAPKVDILWVIDTSRSMSNERRQLADGVLAFALPLLNVEADLHLAVTSMDMQSPSQRGVLQEANGVRWVYSGMPGFLETFIDMATFANSMGQSNREEGRLAAFTALQRALPGGVNQGFLRPDPATYLHVVFVSDEGDDTDPHDLSEEQFVDFLQDLKPPSRVSLHLIRGFDPTPSYDRLIAEIGGTTQSLGLPWSNLHAELAASMTPEPDIEFFLSQLPDPASLEVEILWGAHWSMAEIGTDAHYDPERNSVQFEPEAAPPLGSEVRIRYHLSNAPAP